MRTIPRHVQRMLQESQRATTRGLRRMAGGSIGGRSEQAAPLPERPRAQPYRPSSSTGLGFVGPSVWTGDTDALRDNGTELDLFMQENYCGFVAIPNQDTSSQNVYSGHEAFQSTDSPPSRQGSAYNYAQIDDESEWASEAALAQVWEGVHGPIAFRGVACSEHPAGVYLHSDFSRQGVMIGRCLTTITSSQVSNDAALLFVRDNGAGKDQLCVQFNSGATQVIATEP